MIHIGIARNLHKIVIKKCFIMDAWCCTSIRDNRRYYPGGRCIPSPLKITKYYGKGDLATIASEIIGFTKMNWNSFNLYTKLPATIDTSNTLAQVGNFCINTMGRLTIIGILFNEYLWY